ncbi:hypothetical protein FRC03_008046 [Tulasnella sp. 419]|nr:hypothetical protein FRC03_008046 [Tulasnella sp. 419]
MQALSAGWPGPPSALQNRINLKAAGQIREEVTFIVFFSGRVWGYNNTLISKDRLQTDIHFPPRQSSLQRTDLGK